MNSQQTSHRSSGTFEWSYREALKPPHSLDGLSPGASSDDPITPTNPIARLTRECSALRLRLATAERASRPTSTYSHCSHLPEGIRAPPSSARTPPSNGLNLNIPTDGNTSRPSSYISSATFTYTYAPVNPSLTQNTLSQPLSYPAPRLPQATQRPFTQHRTEKRASLPPPQSRRKQPPAQQQHKPPHSTDHNYHRQMKPAERCKQLEKTLREVQDLLKDRDREIADLKQERDRLMAEREHDRKIMRDREQMRERERILERQREKEREREREQEKRRELEREQEREKEREQQQQRAREEEERKRRLSHSSGSLRRARSQAPASPTRFSPMNIDLEQVAQLRSLDVFLTKTDGWSGAQVIQAVEDLNTEIAHFAASATEICVFDRQLAASHARRGSRRGRGGYSNVDGRAFKGAMLSVDEAAGVAPWLDPSFVKILASRDHEQDPVLVQLALQASVATCCARSLSLFCVGFPSKLDGMLTRVLAHMQITGMCNIFLPEIWLADCITRIEPQPTSSRWRALTHRSIRSLYPGLEEYAISELMATMLRWSGTIFALSGCRLPSEPRGKDIVPSTLRAQLRRIAEAVFKLARITREEILSTNFEVVLAENGQPFVATGMTNTLGEHHHEVTNGRMDQGSVLCTTELGLRCMTRRGKAEGEDAFERRMLLQPKVVLDSTVDALDTD